MTFRLRHVWTAHRRLAVAGLLVALLIVMLGVVHTPLVRGRVLAWVVERLRADAGIRADIEHFEYNLATLRVSIGRTTLAAADQGEPFLTLEGARLDLPWSIVTGRIAIESFEIVGPAITITRDRDGRLNLPAIEEPAPPEESGALGSIDIGYLAVRNLRIGYVDHALELSVEGGAVTLDMVRSDRAALAGRLTLSDSVALKLADRDTRVSRLDSRLSFDGSAIAFDELAIESPEVRLRLDGRVDLLAEAPRIDARYAGRANVERLASWIAPEQALSGAIDFSGTAAGTLDAPNLTFALSGRELAWADQRDIAIDLRGDASPLAATIERLQLGLAGGTVEGRARIGLDDREASRAELAWTRLDLGSLARAAGVDQVRVASRAEGSAAAEWTGVDLTTAGATITATLDHGSAPADALALGGRLSAALERGQWTVSLDGLSTRTIRLDGKASGRLLVDDLVESTLGGGFQVEVENLSALLDELRRAGMALPEESPLASGRATVDTVLSGTLGSLSLRGSLDASDIEVSGVGPGTLTASFTADLNRVSLGSLDVSLGSNAANGNLEIDLGARTLEGTFAADLTRISPLTATLPPEWQLEGAATLRADVGGSLDHPLVELVAEGTGLAVAGQRIERVDLAARLAGQMLTVERFDVMQDGGRLNLTGNYSLASRQFAAQATGRGLAVKPLLTGGDPLPVEARFDLDFSGSGTVDAPRAEGTVDVRDLIWHEYQFGAVQLEASVAGHELRLGATVPALHATLEANAALNAPRSFTADVAVSSADLNSLLRASGPAGSAETVEPTDGWFSLTGAITAEASAKGDLDRLQEAAVDLGLSLVDVTVGGAAIRLDRPARIRYDAGRIVADDFALRIGDATITALGRFGDAADSSGLTLRLKGGLTDFMPFARAASGIEALDSSGSVAVELHTSGTLDAPRVDATVTLADASFWMPDLPRVKDIRLQASLNEGLLTLSEFGAAWQGATLSATGTVPATIFGDGLPEAFTRTLPRLPDRARVEIALDSVTAGVAAPFVDEETLDRLMIDLAAAAVVEATSLELNALNADITLNRAGLAVAGAPLRQERPTRLKLANGRLEVADWTWSGAGNRLSVAGGIGLAGESPAMQIALGGALDLRILGAVAPELAAGGRADFDVQANGPIGEPAIEGEIRVQEGELAIRDPRLALTDLHGRVALTANRVRIVDLRGEANGGTLEISGDVALEGFRPSGGTIGISGRGLAFEIPANLRSEVNADLTFAVSEEAPALTGKITVLRGSYRAPISLTGQLLSGVQFESAVPAEPGFADRIRLSISVVSEEGVLIDNNYGRFEIGSDLRVLGTPSLPVLAGRLTIAEGGAVFLAGQTWTLERGTVDFTSATRIEPTLDLALSTRVQRYEVGLTASGTPETLEVNLRSPDGLSQADAVSLLLTGQLAEQGTATQTDIARGQLLLLLSGEFFGFAGRAVGLDSAQVSRGLGGAASDFDLLTADTDPSARLTITKQLRRDVELVFSQSLRNSNDLTWIAIYRPIRALELRTTTRDDNSRTYEFRNEFNFGGGRAARIAPGRRPAPRVSTVRLTGTPGFDERQLRGRLRLDEGERFDFFRWQQDRDRLSAFYRERGYLEARIRASRETVAGVDGEPAVSLTYSIERGPATSLVIEGAVLSGAVLEAMEESWARAVFDGFLLEDLERMARESLVQDGYLRAETQAEIVEDNGANTRRIVVRIVPGTRYTDRRLVFQGQERISAAELEAFVRERQLSLTAWLQPAEVEAALNAYYRTFGQQSARVSIGEPTFTASAGTLPVMVSEGPQFQIARVEVTGVSTRPVEEVRKAFGIEPGEPYVPSALEPARREVEVSYLRQGYNDVRVAVTSVADAEAPSAHITLDVQEGRQQVLEEVSVSGADTTTAGTVERALDLKLGEPADLSNAYRAQKRLYDTGVFRRADIELEPIGEAAPGGAQPVRAVVSLEEVPRYLLRYGVRITDDTGPLEADREVRPGVVADILRRNLFGRAISTGLAGQLEADRRLVRGIVSTPQFFGLPVTSSLFLTQSRQDFSGQGITPFVEDGSEITAEQRFRPRPTMAVSYDYRFQRTHVFRPSPPPGAIPFDVRVNVARLTSTFAWDTRDDPFNPRRGWLRSAGVEYAAAALGSDLRFIKGIGQLFYFRPVGEEVVLASAFRLGVARGFDQTLIPSERFYVGGGTSVRGFSEDGLGEVDFLGDLTGGAGSLILNQEVRFPIYKWVRGVGFFDAGNVFPRVRDLSLTDLEVGTGFGLRIDTPFGLARIDFAMPLTRRSREPFGRWYFSIGQAF
jgi:outer membrane protein insertion porin family